MSELLVVTGERLVFSGRGLLKKAVSRVLIAWRARRTDPYASPSSRLAALLIVIFEQALVAIPAVFEYTSDLTRSRQGSELFNGPLNTT